jgi:hypothetical protein
MIHETDNVKKAARGYTIEIYSISHARKGILRYCTVGLIYMISRHNSMVYISAPIGKGNMDFYGLSAELLDLGLNSGDVSSNHFANLLTALEEQESRHSTNAIFLGNILHKSKMQSVICPPNP